jgi:hypothetical protein
MATGRKTGGRTKGTPNKVTKALRDMILGALDEAGGQEYLTRQAGQNPTAFMALLGKVLPTQLTGDPAQPVVVEMTSAERELEARNLIRKAFGKPLLTIEELAQPAAAEK